MKYLLQIAKLDISESLRSKWFWVYSLVFGGIIISLFLFGLTESRVLGFVGLSRLLVTYIQLCMAVLPIFVLITTVRSVAGDREAGVFEYLLSLPVSLGAWYWGKLIGRYVVIFLPVVLSLVVGVLFGSFKQIEIPWFMFFYYSLLLAVLAWFFLGVGMAISSFARSADIAQGVAFVSWLVLLLFIDLILLGLMIQNHLRPEWAVGISLANPLQVFRTAALSLFDPQMIVLGPSAYLILDIFGSGGYKVYGIAYPFGLGLIFMAMGYWKFKRGDLV